MTTRILTITLAAVLSLAGAAAAAITTGSYTDEEIAQKAAREIRTYSRYTLWDNIRLSVADGVVELQGQVSQPFKKADLQRIVASIPGVAGVANQLEVLPTSFYDDELRLRVARAVYGDPVLSRYAYQAVPPIHIIVKNGQVTLEGVVNNELEKTVALHRAAAAGLSLGQVVNNLAVEQPKRSS